MGRRPDPVNLDKWDILILAVVGLVIGIMLIQVAIRFNIFF